MTETNHNLLPDLYARWERIAKLREEQDEILKELFAEAKQAQLKPKALRVAFKLAFNPEAKTKADELGAEVELYLDSLAGLPARVVSANTVPTTQKAIEHKPQTPISKPKAEVLPPEKANGTGKGWMDSVAVVNKL